MDGSNESGPGSVRGRLDRIADSLRRVDTSRPGALGELGERYAGAERGAFSLLGGTLYAFRCAAEQGWPGGQPVEACDTDRLDSELRSVAEALADCSPRSRLEELTGLRCTHREERELPGIWLAGFHFNAALERLAASADRLRVHVVKDGERCSKSKCDERSRPTTSSPRRQDGEKCSKSKCDGKQPHFDRCAYTKVDLVCRCVNSFKHDPQGVVAGKAVGWEEGLGAFEEILRLCRNERLLVFADDTDAA